MGKSVINVTGSAALQRQLDEIEKRNPARMLLITHED